LAFLCFFCFLFFFAEGAKSRENEELPDFRFFFRLAVLKKRAPRKKKAQTSPEKLARDAACVKSKTQQKQISAPRWPSQKARNRTGEARWVCEGRLACGARCHYEKSYE
jgi:hypothetical protein